MLYVYRGQPVYYRVHFENTGEKSRSLDVGFTLIHEGGIVIDLPWSHQRSVKRRAERDVVVPIPVDTTDLQLGKWTLICIVWADANGKYYQAPGWPREWYLNGYMIGFLDENTGYNRDFTVIK